MKRTVSAVIFLLSLTSSLHAMRVTSVDDVIRLHNSGVSDERIQALLERMYEPLAVTPEDVTAMKQAGLSSEVIDAVLVAATSSRDEATPSDQPPAEDAPASSDDEWCLTFDPPVMLVLSPPYFAPPWLWDPFWYMPRLDSRAGAQGQRSGESKAEATDRASPKMRQSERPRSDTATARLERPRATSSRRR